MATHVTPVAAAHSPSLASFVRRRKHVLCHARHVAQHANNRVIISGNVTWRLDQLIVLLWHVYVSCPKEPATFLALLVRCCHVRALTWPWTRREPWRAFGSRYGRRLNRRLECKWRIERHAEYRRAWTLDVCCCKVGKDQIGALANDEICAALFA